ncbi:GRAS transcription factor [Parasponia andersonii]|uniref:GRAS transcription factor n=1 Tax=Parasponia andersonii TaxID=3476 RepID=A0A2P5AJ01_PARAD|nr:GRAS transcription factor [Parasponia andersonii]
MEAINCDEEKLLNLSLEIVSDSGGERKRKRKSRHNVGTSYEGCTEGKIFRLLQMREQMLKLDHKRSKATTIEDGSNGLRLIQLLLITASSINENDTVSALENLKELYKGVSLNGDSVQRVVAYYADGLAAKLLGRKSPFFDMIMKEPTAEEEFLAFMDLYRVSPYYQFAHFTANQAIIESFEKEEEKNNRALHVIDFDISYGFQWPSLIQSLSEKATGGNRISLQITGFGRSQEELQETENRLLSFAKGFRNLVFDFQGLLRGRSYNNIINNLRKKRNETVAVNLVFHLNTLEKTSKMEETLNLVQSISPSVVILVEQEGSRSPRNFLSRFMESLHYFAAMFDSLDDCLPLESAERLSIEKNHLGKEIKTMLNYGFDHHDHGDHDDDHNRCPKYERLETWKARMESHGFGGVIISSKSVIQAKLLLKMRTHYCPLQFDGDNSNGGAGFRVFERDEGRAISLGWQNRYLLTASMWQCL